ncbi:MAG: DNA repair protein RecO [Rhodospirillaceae bacterium]|nr:DNA repair protein RecO [Rhodospirillaceae bacterium]
MNWSDEGIVLSARKHGESAAIVTLLTRTNGRYSGLVHGGSGSRARGIYQTGNLVSADWRARLSEHLGTMSCELLRPYSAALMTERLPLLALISAGAILERLLPEREPHPETFERFQALIESLGDGPDWVTGYVRWERRLLEDLGYGLDLIACAATGTTDDLIYVSPRTGCAVSAGAGGPYSDKLLKLPAFFLGSTDRMTRDDIRDGLRVTGHFLARCAKDANAGDLPAARAQFVDRLRRDATISGNP